MSEIPQTQVAFQFVGADETRLNTDKPVPQPGPSPAADVWGQSEGTTAPLGRPAGPTEPMAPPHATASVRTISIRSIPSLRCRSA